MKQMELIIRENSIGEEEVWYSEDYIKRQIDLAYIAGLAAGSKIELHLVEPNSLESVIDYNTLFWNRINDEFVKHFKDGHVWDVVNKKTGENINNGR